MISGTVADSSGAIIPGAEIDLTDATGATVVKTTTDASGAFQVKAPRAGNYNVQVSINGFQPATKTVTVTSSATPAAPVSFTLAVAEAVQQVTVNAGSQVDLTSSDSNGNTSVMSASDMKDLPIFDNDYVTAMSSFLDGGSEGTSGSGLMVDGMEANRALVSPSAVQEVRINQDPYSAQYFWPGRGQIDIITKQAADAYHGEFNFTFRDSAMNAQEDFSPSKPYEQRQIYEGSLTGPVAHSKSTMFLFSLNRAVEDLTAVVNATVAPTAENPDGVYNENVPAPTTDTEFSIKIGHQFTDSHSASVMYSFQNAHNTNSGVGNQTLPEAGYDTQTREDDLTLHDNYIVSGSMLNEASLALERSYDPVKDVQEGPMLVVSGNYTGGSAQADQLNTEYNLRANEMLTWTVGPHTLKFGVNVPHFGRRVRDDMTNEDGTYTFSPTYAADGSVIATSIENQQAGVPSGFSMANGQTRFVYHQQEVGAFVQDQIKLKPWFSVTPGLRYDWQTFPGDTNNFSPRISFAWVWDQKHEMVLRGGAGVYFDRSGSGPLIDLARYQDAKRRLMELSSNQETLCYPITNCIDTATLPVSYVELQQGIRTPYDVEYGLTLERKVGEKGVVSVGGRISRWTGLYRSIDENAPLGPDYTTRPNPNISQLRQIQSEGKQIGSALDINYRGRFNKRFTGFAWYTLANSGNNTDGISWFPENQRDPEAEWGPSSWEQRNKFGVYGAINPQHLLNLGVGVFANSGKPWSILTGTDAYGTDLFNARPDGVPRNSEIGPDYADVDLRWGYDFKLQPKEVDKSPTLGFSVSSFDVLNHPNGSYVDTTEGSTDFGQVTSAYAPRRTQLAMRFQF
ncbi:TonB-dependent receptor [Silvibacterium dinghuense]|uniref:TonB-dependent receptor n=1 Tax=Silvibacterium dinghuense TaxID=1560006 RepID=A0A4Q1SE88_9BACT|nr:TonB-dependent receptor [Silvibacterium dinghuense]RXS95579.1 TonB-dependent receptor [Silvibacterium dinghuense]GGH14171.1 TonB-dependent receptor [Silvibacterium dinghuense]